MDDVLSMPCKAHNALIFDLLKHSNYPDIRESPIKQLYVCKKNHQDALALWGDVADEVHTAGTSNFYLLADSSKTGRVTAREIHGQMIQFSLLRRWKYQCDRHHGASCRDSPFPASVLQTRPRWLVDTWTQSLVSGAQSNDYVALSYVWGNVTFFTTNRENIERLQTPGAFADITLPKTIQDALVFTKKVGERYCWVDALCIVQDDRAAKYAEIENMSSIFANASFTIIAEGSNSAYSGLPGISTPRKIDHAIYALGRGFKLLAERPSEVGKTAWSTRAWTYQEDLFSRRKMIFDTQSVRWECPRMACCEHLCGPRGPSSFQSEEVECCDRMSSRFPDSHVLRCFIENYNPRDLTYEEDALNAFSGVMKPLCNSLKHGFLSGLPLSFFDMALLWQPEGKAVRRVPIHDTTHLPSWSWAGWKCNLTDRNWLYWDDYMKPSEGCGWYDEAVIPLVSMVIPSGTRRRAYSNPFRMVRIQKRIL